MVALFSTSAGQQLSKEIIVKRQLICLVAAVLACSAVMVRDAFSDYTTMKIIAHEDDDILFMNLELRNMIAAGDGLSHGR